MLLLGSFFTVTWIKCLNHYVLAPMFKELKKTGNIDRIILMTYSLNSLRNLTHWVKSHLLNTGFYKLFYIYLYCLCLSETKAALQKKHWALIYIFLIWFGVPFGVTLLKVLCFWCFLCKVVGSQGLLSYSRHNLLWIANLLSETSANIYFQHYIIHYIVYTQSVQYII